MSGRLTWEYGPEVKTRRSGCTTFSEAGGHRWEVHRYYERSLISGRNLTMFRLYVDGELVGLSFMNAFEARAKADQMQAALNAGRTA